MKFQFEHTKSDSRTVYMPPSRVRKKAQHIKGAMRHIYQIERNVSSQRQCRDTSLWVWMLAVRVVTFRRYLGAPSGCLRHVSQVRELTMAGLWPYVMPRNYSARLCNYQLFSASCIVTSSPCSTNAVIMSSILSESFRSLRKILFSQGASLWVER